MRPADVLEIFFTKNILSKPLLDDAPIGIFLVEWGDTKENKGKILYANMAAEEMLGYSKFEICKKRFQDFTHSEDIESDEEMTSRIKPFSMIKRYLTKNNKVIWVKLTANPVYDMDENFMCYISFVEKLPNGGNFKVETDNRGDYYVRPQVNLANFLQDNWRAVMMIALVLLGYIEKEQVMAILTKFFL